MPLLGAGLLVLRPGHVPHGAPPSKEGLPHTFLRAQRRSNIKAVGGLPSTADSPQIGKIGQVCGTCVTLSTGIFNDPQKVFIV